MLLNFKFGLGPPVRARSESLSGEWKGERSQGPNFASNPLCPKPQVGGTVTPAGGQAYTIKSNYAVSATPDVSWFHEPVVSVGHPKHGGTTSLAAVSVPLSFYLRGGGVEVGVGRGGGGGGRRMAGGEGGAIDDDSVHSD
jgi:hypothetical protein